MMENKSSQSDWLESSAFLNWPWQIFKASSSPEDIYKNINFYSCLKIFKLYFYKSGELVQYMGIKSSVGFWV